ncbi:related to Actin cytoskeleton-regulatory complex protein SLA1 [Saccharomycodes ludwigii]|uniref:Actin cytoskeleton-regulatory complex protein SLA1 n=1 Tax=Saccharomycodes ludwigii TaxID=36035 RepID=A0A376B4T0_9ASCO|nr:related to Actin cytoskeleton-regulatory complex protein SLA1 [Saccharomycodes ludwigii]
MTSFLGVYKAVYSYQPTTPDELAINEGDILYLLEKSTVDDWWTVKKRVIGTDVTEPVGLVPNNYVEPMQPIGQTVALYDYLQVQNPEEELKFKEGDVFDLYDENDPDWLLCKNVTNNEYGFVPGNYVEKRIPGAAPTPAAAASMAKPLPVVTTPANAISFPPPPQRIDRPSTSSITPITSDVVIHENDQAQQGYNTGAYEDDDFALPPPKPARPNGNNQEDDFLPAKPARPVSMAPSDNIYGNDDVNNADPYNRNINAASTQFHSWIIQEILGRKKVKCKLAIGNNTIFYTSSNADSVPEQWNVADLVSYDNEKKHLFLEFTNPPASLEFHTGNSKVADEIVAVLGELKGVYSSAGLKEVQNATASGKKAGGFGNGSKKQAKVLEDFIAEAPKEISVTSGEVVNVIDDTSSKNWTLVEIVDTGERGLVPADFLHNVSQLSSMMGSLKNKFTSASVSRRKSIFSKKKPTDSSWKDDAGQDYEGSNINNTRDRSSSNANKRSRARSFSRSDNNNNNNNNNNTAARDENDSKKSKQYPNPAKTRMWMDRTGSFKVEAEFVGCAEGKIHLHKVNGVKIAVPAEKLSDSDLCYVEKVTGFSLDRYKSSLSNDSDNAPVSNGGNNGGNNVNTAGMSAIDKERERRRRAKDREEREKDKQLREQELTELRKARQLLDQQREDLRYEKEQQERQRRMQESTEARELPPAKPPRPSTAASTPSVSSSNGKPKYDWFEFFLNCGVDVNSCQRYTINFDRESLTEDMLPEITAGMLRTLGLREGDIIRVMKYLDNKFGRIQEQQPQPSQTSAAGGMFSAPDGSLKINKTGGANLPTEKVRDSLLPTANASEQKSDAVSATIDDRAWTVKPAAATAATTAPAALKSEFQNSMQDLLDLKPLEPAKAPTPIPLKELEAIKTGTQSAQEPKYTPTATVNNPPETSLSPVKTGGIAPLNPFKTGGNNILPIMVMPIVTGGVGMMPQTTFGTLNPALTGGAFNPALTGGVLNPALTGGALNPALTGGALNPALTGGMPQTTFGALKPIATGGNAVILPVQKTGGGLVPINTGGLMPQTTFGASAPQVTGGLPQPSFANNFAVSSQLTGGANGTIPQTSFTNNNLAFQQRTGGAMPQTSFGQSAVAPVLTGGLPQTTFGNTMNPVLTGGASALTGGANIMPQTSFGVPLLTGGANIMPQTSFGALTTNGNMNPALTGGMNPALTGGMNPAFTGGMNPAFTGNMNPALTGGMNPALTGGIMAPQATNTGFIPQSNFGITLQKTGGIAPMPQTSFGTSQVGGGVNNDLSASLSNMNIYNHQQPIQSQPTGFGFGNGPQQQQQQQQQANLFNATPDNPFGFQ